ncbi:NAD-dependent epimerase/dehydratase family protein [Paracoccus yeei]|uniref:NAD-dependent epimerase/dehydratase family protein n=1 Tax=Paracoccus yeei TaxID=147645 RepID=UPI003BF91CA8
MTLLVTGATGFIGTNLTESLLCRGHAVVALANQPPQESARRHLLSLGDVRFVQADVRDQAAVERVIRQNGVRRVVHGAVVTSDAARERQGAPFVIDVNLVGTAAVASAAGACGVERFVYMGSAGVFTEGNHPDAAPLDEDEPHEVGTLYAISKSAAEAIALRVAALWNMPAAVGRIGTAFGPWEHDTGFRDTLSPVWQLTDIAARGERARLARDKRKNWHYARDAADALARLVLADGSRHRVYNLGPSAAWPLSRWCERLKAAFPGFDYGFGLAPNVELYGDNDGGYMTGDRFADEFGPVARFGPDDAFDDFMAWRERHGG